MLERSVLVLSLQEKEQIKQIKENFSSSLLSILCPWLYFTTGVHLHSSNLSSAFVLTLSLQIINNQNICKILLPLWLYQKIPKKQSQ